MSAGVKQLKFLISSQETVQRPLALDRTPLQDRFILASVELHRFFVNEEPRLHI